MGRHAKKIDLTAAEKWALTEGFKTSKSKRYAQRCHIILLKHQGKSSQEIANIYDITIQPVNKWCKRYQKEGITGLQTRKGQGRHKILDKAKDEKVVRKIIETERQKLSLAKEMAEKELDKSFSKSTFKRFLKNLSANGNELG